MTAVSRQAAFMPGAFGAGGVDAEPGSTIPPKHVASRTGVDDPGYNSSPITNHSFVPP